MCNGFGFNFAVGSVVVTLICECGFVSFFVGRMVVVDFSIANFVSDGYFTKLKQFSYGRVVRL